MLSSFNLDAPRTVRFYRRVRIHIRRRNKRNLTRSTKKTFTERSEAKPWSYPHLRPWLTVLAIIRQKIIKDTF